MNDPVCSRCRDTGRRWFVQGVDCDCGLAYPCGHVTNQEDWVMTLKCECQVKGVDDGTA